MKIKKAVLDYPFSDNLGDYIQSIAAASFMGENPDFLDREQLDRGAQTPTQLLLNGWFMENPKNWPPGPEIDPLFISFHMNPTVEKQMLNPKGIHYLQQHAPIGCRDHYTLRVLEKHQIPAYFSGCLTLSLEKNFFAPMPGAPDEPYLFWCSTLERLNPQNNPTSLTGKGLINAFKNPFRKRKYNRAVKALAHFVEQTQLPNIRRSQIAPIAQFSKTQRLQMAEEQLRWIAHARLVVTSRIHTALPAVAMGVPVVFVSDGLEHPNQFSRLEGLLELFYTCKAQELSQCDWQAIQPTEQHLPWVENMQTKISEFLKK
ncbi:MAG: polysaccharide pyruvyl transferase family protein [Flavobacteriaceae bacterium]